MISSQRLEFSGLNAGHSVLNFQLVLPLLGADGTTPPPYEEGATLVYRGTGTLDGSGQAMFGRQGTESLTQSVEVEVRLMADGTATGTISGEQVLATQCPMGTDEGGNVFISDQSFTTTWTGTHADGRFSLNLAELGAEFSIDGTYDLCGLSGAGERTGSFDVPCPSHDGLTGQQTMIWKLDFLPRAE